MIRKLAPIIIFFMLCGCAQMGINLDTPEKKCLAARTELNVLLEQYIQIQGDIALNDRINAKTAFYSADRALDAWERQIGNAAYEWSTDMQIWLDAKTVILEIIGRYTK